MADDPVHTSVMAPSASAWRARIAGSALTEGIRPLVEPLFDAAAAEGMLRDGVTPDRAIAWLQIVASGLTASPNIEPDRDELRGLLEATLVPSLFTARG